MRIPSGTADQYLYFVAVDATDFSTRETGLSSFTVYRSRDGAAAAAMTTPTINETDSTNMPGVYELLLDEDMTIGSGNDSEEMVFHVTHAGMAPVTRTIELYRPKITVGETLTVSSGSATTDALNAAGIRSAVGMSSANLDTQLSAIDTVVDSILVDTAEIGAAGAGLTSIPWNASWDAEVQSECADALTAYDGIVAADLGTFSNLGSGTTLADNLTDMAGGTFSASTDSLEAIRNRGDAAWTTGAGGNPPQLLQSTTIATLASQTSFTLTAGSADDDAYNGAIIVITDQSTATQKAVGSITDYTGSTKTVTLSADPAIFTMATGDTVEVIAALGSAGSAPTAAQIRSEIDSNSTQLAAIVADTNELQLDWADGGRLDLILDAKASQSSVDVVDGNVDSILTDTGTTIPAQISGLNDPSAAVIADAVWDEAQSGHTTSGSFGEVATEIASILADTNELQTDDIPSLIAALNDLDAAAVRAAIGLSTANLDTQLAALPTNAEVNAEIVDALNTDTYAESSGVVDATATIAAMITWLKTLSRNTITQTATTQTLRNDANSGDIATSTVSDDATTFTRGEFS